MHTTTPSRRRLLAAAAGVVAGATAGCAGGADSDGSGSESDDSTEPTTTEPPTADPTATDATAPPSDGSDLDLREANVVGVAVERNGDTYDFDVTLHHDDDGEEGYANWWQVERLDGERLGRRELLHAHSTAPFTRSETVEIPNNVDCVVVRGHDQTHGYGGRAAALDLGSSAVRFVDQGPELQSVDADACPGG